MGNSRRRPGRRSDGCGPRHDDEEHPWQNRQNPLGGAYVSGLEQRDENGAYAVPEAAWRPVGATPAPFGPCARPVRGHPVPPPGTATFLDAHRDRVAATATGSFRTA